jgi:Ran GTPase-activating protein (RanGAP) involved in mRNA processing and transport
MRAVIENALKACQNQEQVNLSGMQIEDNEITAIMEALNPFKDSVMVLILDNNKLTDEGAVFLADYLKDYDLKALSLQYNDIGKNGALAVFELKRGLPSLDILFRGNQIKDVGEMAKIEQHALRDAYPKPSFS